MEIKRGMSFQWNEGSGVCHTWFVVTHEQNDKYIILNISSSAGKKFIDSTCVFKADVTKYQKITQDSYVFYRDASIKGTLELIDILNDESNGLNPQAPCWMIDVMASGLMKSKGASERVKSHYRTVFSQV
mgnify:CR=1 FL=1